MAEAQFDALRGRRLLVVEDEYIIAADLARTLEERGIDVVGPVGSVEEALELVETGDRLDGAILDVNLGGEKVYRVADALIARAVPFVFATGYDAFMTPQAYAGVPRCEKPVDTAVLARVMAGHIDKWSS